jgi:hypothetical protein
MKMMASSVAWNVRKLDLRVQGYVLEIFFSSAVSLIDEHHFKELIRRGIKEYSRKYDINPLPISRDFGIVSSYIHA